VTSQKIYQTPANVRLCSLETIADGKARNFVLDIAGKYFHGFIVRRGSEVFGYVDLCPHMQLPLAQKLDHYLTPDGQLIACSWHDALFRIENGKCVGGPCTGQSLQTWPVKVENGFIVTA
jgi:nitrite reductase/ring-hydroxylating ferredoxin subunit